MAAAEPDNNTALFEKAWLTAGNAAFAQNPIARKRNIQTAASALEELLSSSEGIELFSQRCAVVDREPPPTQAASESGAMEASKRHSTLMLLQEIGDAAMQNPPVNQGQVNTLCEYAENLQAGDKAVEAANAWEKNYLKDRKKLGEDAEAAFDARQSDRVSQIQEHPESGYTWMAGHHTGAAIAAETSYNLPDPKNTKAPKASGTLDGATGNSGSQRATEARPPKIRNQTKI